MKIVLLQDVPNVGRAGDVREVADGYGRNFLIPQNLAVLANSSAISMIEVQRKISARNQANNRAQMVELANQLDGKEITLKARAGAKDRLYGSITNADIADELESTMGLVIDKRKIELARPIHQLGSYEVVIRLAKDVIPTIKVTVTEKETD